MGGRTISDVSNYGFILTAFDCALLGVGGSQKFRIKIWDLGNDAEVVNDNQPGAGQNDDLRPSSSTEKVIHA